MSRAKSSSPIKSRLSPSKATCIPSQCPVSDPELRIISENDHRVGLCLCKFCQCGQHSCPNPLNKDLYPSSTFTSKYQSDYRKGKFDTVLYPISKPYQPNTSKMDLKTTNQEEYKAHSISPAKRNPLVWNSNIATAQTRSLYSSEYVNWGPSTFSHEKRFHPPVRSTEIPFRGSSSYQNSFTQVDPRQADLFRTNGKDLHPAGSKIELGPNQFSYFRSTYSDKMQDFSNNQLNRIVRVAPAPQELFLESTPQFKTTSASFYTGNMAEGKDPRLVRMQLKKHK